MVRLLQPPAAAVRALLLSRPSSALSHLCHPNTLVRTLSPPPTPPSTFSQDPPFSSPPRRNYIAEMRHSAFKENILRILRTEIDYETDLRPPKQPVEEFKDFTVDDHPGVQWIRLRKKGKNEVVKVEVTMFDGAVPAPAKTEESSRDGAMNLHISLIVDVVKELDTHNLQFVCSAWPDALEIENAFIIRHHPVPLIPYMGPNFKDMDEELQIALQGFLADRGLDDEFAAFLHQYMSNKDRTEFVRWMGNVKSYVEK